MNTLEGKAIVITGGGSIVITSSVAVVLFPDAASGCNGNTYLMDGGYCAQ